MAVRSTTLIAALCLLAVSCGRALPCPANVLRAMDDPGQVPESASVRFFPAGTFLPPPHTPRWTHAQAEYSDTFTRRMLAAELLDLHERPFPALAADRNAEAYRVLDEADDLLALSVLWVQATAENAVFEIKRAELRSCRPVAPGAGIAYRLRTGQLDARTWTGIRSCFRRAFWSETSYDGDVIEDSTTTVVEGVEGGRFHAVLREALHSDNPEPDRRALVQCLRMLYVAAGIPSCPTDPGDLPPSASCRNW